MIRDSFIKLGRETKSPFITNPFRFAGVQWATALTNWLKRKPLTINGAAKTADFTELYTTNSGFTKIGTLLDVDNHVADKVAANAAPGNARHGEYKSLGLTLNDEFWTADFDFQFTSHADTKHFAFALVAGTDSIEVTSQDMVSVTTDGNAAGLRIAYKDGAGAITFNPSGNAIATTLNTQYYCRFQRISSTKLKLIVYLDSDRTEVSGSTEFTIPSTITGLTTLQHMTRTADSALTQSWNIDNTNIYNGITTVENIPSQQTATFSDDFSGTDNWTDSDSAIIGVNTTTDVMDVTERATVGDEVTYKTFTALGTDANFVYRTEFGITAFTQSATVEMIRTTIGLSSADDIAQTTTRDEVGITWQLGNSGGINKFYCFTADAAQLPTSGTDFTTITPTASTTYYMEIIGNGGTYTFNIYSDSNYSVLLETKTITDAGITGLDNMVVRSTAFTTHNQTLDVAIQQIKRWDNITEVNPTTLTDYPLPIKIIGDTNLQRKTAETFDEDFATDDWTELGTGSNITIQNGQLEFSTTAGATERKYYDLTSDTRYRSFIRIYTIWSI